MLKTMLKTKPIRFNRIIAMLLSLIMLCGILPFSALPLDVFAAELIDYEISICGIRITSNNIDLFESAENNRYGVAFDKSSNTLYLSAPDVMSVTNVNFISYFGKGTLTVVVLQDTKILCNGDSGFLHAESGSVVFSAESKGSLSITNGLATAIKADKLTIEGGEILMNLPQSGIYWNTAIEANVISVNGGFLDVYGVRMDDEHGGVSEFRNTGIVYNTEMTVSGGVVAVYHYAYGIVAKDDNADFNIKGGEVGVSAFRTGVKDGSLCHTAGALFAGGDEHGIYAAEIQVSGTAKLVAYNGVTYTGESYPVYAKGELKVDTNVFFISKPEGGYVKDHPYGGKLVYNSSTNQPAVGMVEFMPRVSCFVSRNDGPEEEYALTYSPEGSTETDLFRVPVGDKIVVRLVANDGQLLSFIDRYGFITVAQTDFLTTQLSDDKKELTFTFEPTYLPDAAWTYNDVSQMWENKYDKDQSKAGGSVCLSPPADVYNPYYRFSHLIFEAVLGESDWEVSNAKVTIPRGETLRVRVPLKTNGGRDIAVSKEEFEAGYKLLYCTSYILNDGYDITHDGESSVIAELEVADNAYLKTEQVMWEFFFSNSYDKHRFHLTATVVECWCDMGERLIERPVSEAACTVGGCAVKHWECSKCGKLFADANGNTPITDPQTVLTPAKGHSFTETVGDGYLKSAADCENPAVYYKSCEYCGLSSKELYDLRAAAANFVPGSAETVTIDGVEFYILAVDDGKALLLTKDVVDSGMAFDTDSPAWEGSDIQRWLNGEWLDGKPRLAALAEPADIYTAAAYNDQENTVASRDKVFLLSEADVTGEHNRSSVTNTALYTYNGARLTAPGGGWGINGAHWWLRSPCNFSQYVSAVTDYGRAHSYAYSETSTYVRPRPAMWVRFADPDPDPTPEWQYKIGKIEPGSAETVTIDGVKFHVLAKDAAKGEALLLTKDVLFNRDDDLVFSHKNPSWADSLLREFMNGILAQTSGGSRFFYPYQAPTLAQYAQETEIYTPAGYDSTEFVTTRDTFFLLSEADVFGTQNSFAVTDPRYYTFNGKLSAPGGSWVATDKDGTSRNWWLRSPRYNRYSVAQVLADADMNSINYGDFGDFIGVRPAVWIQYREPVPEPETFENGDALGHDWGAASYDWSYTSNGTQKGCTASHTCKRCDHTETEDAKVTSSQTTDPTCTAQGQITYTARFTNPAFATQHAYSDVAMLEHSWGETVDAKYLKTAADCEHPAVYFKSCEHCNIAHDSETFNHGDPLGHSFGTPVYTWGPGNSTCTAQRTCTRDGCIQGEFGTATVTSEQTKDPSCTAQGQITYTARFTNPAFATQYKYVNVAKLEHDWGETVDANYLKSAADCEHPAVYFKSCEHCNIAHDSETFNHGDALGHLFGKPAYSWETLRGSENRTCTAIRECERKGCDHFEEEKATVSVAKTKDPTCTEKGQYTYTAAFKNTAFETQNDYSDIAELGHEWVEKAEDKYLKTAADCTNAAVYFKSCSRCNIAHDSETFVHGDPLGHNWVEKVEDKYLKSAADCEHAAVYHKSCEHCSIAHDTETFENGDALGHLLGDWYVVTHATDRQKGLNRSDCEREGCEHFETSETDTVKYKLELEESDGGKTTVEPADPQSGDGVKITVEPEEDKRVKEITVTDKDGNKIDVTDKGDGEYEFTMPEGDVKIVVEYEPKPVVSVDENEGGKTKVEPEYPDAGDEVKITVEPEEDKRVKEITVTDEDGNKIDVTDKGNGEYEFTMPDGDVTIEVEYEPKPVVSVEENEGGKTVVGPKHPDTGDEVDFTVTPEDGKKIKEITVTDKEGNVIDVTDKGNGGYIFTMPDSDVTIEVVYESIVKPSPEIPPTGDNSKLLLWLMLMCISGIGVIATSLKGKKRKYNS